jgi:hypothetical protein
VCVCVSVCLSVRFSVSVFVREGVFLCDCMFVLVCV